MDVKSCGKLQARGIITSIRYQKGVGGIRVSTHFFNTEDEIDRLLSVQGTLLK